MVYGTGVSSDLTHQLLCPVRHAWDRCHRAHQALHNPPIVLSPVSLVRGTPPPTCSSPSASEWAMCLVYSTPCSSACFATVNTLASLECLLVFISPFPVLPLRCGTTSVSLSSGFAYVAQISAKRKLEVYPHIYSFISGGRDWKSDSLWMKTTQLGGPKRLLTRCFFVKGVSNLQLSLPVWLEAYLYLVACVVVLDTAFLAVHAPGEVYPIGGEGWKYCATVL